jgi:hypothetical protein
MTQVYDPSLEGSVMAVAADRGHHFSKPPQEQIVLVEGHGPRSEFRPLARASGAGRISGGPSAASG